MTTSGTGKARRIQRIVDPADGRSVILPLDGVLVVGCMPGAENLAPQVDFGGQGVPDAVLARYGEARRLAPVLPAQVGLIVRLSGSGDDGPDPSFEQVMHSVEGAAALGADGVCATLKLGSAREGEMMHQLGRIAEACDRHGIVFLCEAFALDAHGQGQMTGERPARAARIAQELGADAVKISNPCDREEMAAIAAWCQLPIVVAGGDMVTPVALVNAVVSALEGGAAGVAIGRNVISHPEPAMMRAVLADLVHGRASRDQALARLDAVAALPRQ
jgi:DhnA family fructose-bisphosphate aldolase class Ia